MNKKLILIFGVLLLVVTACNFPVGKKTATPMPTPTPDTSMQLYYGQGMQIMLPPSYIAEDIKTQLPNIIETLTNLVGDSEGFARDLIREIEGNVAWYGFDGDTPAVYPTRLIVIKNKSLAALPVGIITLGLEQVLGRNQTEVDRN